MKCPKCRFVNHHDAKECDNCGVVFAHIRGGKESKRVDLNCPWNDHGVICGVRGWMSTATNGDGPWYCSKHFWQLKGEPEKVATDTEPLTYREQWYREHKLDYEPPKIVDCPPFKAVGYMPTAPMRAG